MSRRHRATTVALLSSSIAGLLGLSTLAVSPAAAYAPADGQVFVNEIHYDNAGTDSGEAIEVAAPAGTDLAGWSVVLYNGANSSTYGTRTLSGTVTDQQGGFGTTVLAYPSNGIQNGNPDGVALVDASGAVVQFLSYGGTITAANGPAAGMTSTDIGVTESSTTPAGQSLQLAGTGDSYGDFDWAAAAASTFGSVNTGQTFGEGGGDPDPEPEPEPCDVAVTDEIGEVQGSGDTTSYEGQTVTVEGVVVGDFQAQGQLGGVFIQDADGDGDASTSDGIFVYDTDAPDLAVGDVVRVTGTATEFNGLTEINEVTSIGDCGDAATPEPTVLDLPADDAARERVESMLVSFDEPLTATETFTLARYGELVVSAEGRLYTPTNGGSEDDAAEQAANDLRRLVIDDGSEWQNPDDVPFSDVNGTGEVIRLGDTLTGVQGVLSYGHDAWRLQPTADPTVARTNPRPASPDEVGGDIEVASFNVLNYFTTIDVPGAETDGGHDPRGADSQEEFERQQAKIVAAINELDADVVGLMEIENDSDDEAVLNLVAALNEAAGEERYAAIEEPGAGLFGTDAIKVAMIYQPDSVRQMDQSYTTQDDAFDNARLPLAQRFSPIGGGQPFTVVVNHFKSKSCGGATGENADQGDGQGCWNPDRVEQAGALLDFMATLDGEDFLVIGDLNSYGEEDPIDVLEAAGYVDMVDARLAESDQYSYVFSGQAGYLDHALASPHLARRIAGVDIWHINSDEALFLDYNTEFNPEGFWDASPYRSSDHDPVLVGLAARPNR